MADNNANYPSAKFKTNKILVHLLSDLIVEGDVRTVHMTIDDCEYCEVKQTWEYLCTTPYGRNQEFVTWIGEEGLRKYEKQLGD